MFKVGDEVVKARPYSDETYCYHGGEYTDCPIGIKGVIVDILDDDTEIAVDFNLLCEWHVHPHELDLYKKSLKRLLEEL